MNITIEIPEIIEEELRNQGLKKMQIQEIYRCFINEKVGHILPDKDVLENFNTFIVNDRVRWETEYPEFSRSFEQME